MKYFVAGPICFLPMLIFSLESANPEHKESHVPEWKQEDPPKAIRDPPLTSGTARIDKYASATPIKKNDRIIGYKVTPTEQGIALFSKLGLLPGDVITKINGISLANHKNAIRALRRLVKAPSINLDLLRNGVEVSLSVPIE